MSLDYLKVTKIEPITRDLPPERLQQIEQEQEIAVYVRVIMWAAIIALICLMIP